jgi:hypothetical protein
MLDVIRHAGKVAVSEVSCVQQGPGRSPCPRSWNWPWSWSPRTAATPCSPPSHLGTRSGDYLLLGKPLQGHGGEKSSTRPIAVGRVIARQLYRLLERYDQPGVEILRAA